MRRFIAVMVVATFCLVSITQAADDSKSEAKFNGPGQVLNMPKTVAKLSGDQQVVTHKLEDVQVGVQGTRGKASTAAMTATIWSPLQDHEKPVPVRQRIRGSIDVDAGIKATVTLYVNGETTVIALPKSGHGDFETEVITAVPPHGDYLATLCLVLQLGKRDPKIQGVLTLKTLEITIAAPPAKKKQN